MLYYKMGKSVKRTKRIKRIKRIKHTKQRVKRRVGGGPGRPRRDIKKPVRYTDSISPDRSKSRPNKPVSRRSRSPRRSSSPRRSRSPRRASPPRRARSPSPPRSLALASHGHLTAKGLEETADAGGFKNIDLKNPFGE